MIRLDAVALMTAWSSTARAEGQRIGFVPTMGALHEGHLSLVRRSAEECDASVVSIFVNPLQFGPGEDFERYPRDLDRDSRLLEREGTDALFTTTPAEMYPPGFATAVVPGPAGDRFEGASRPGHFRGVLTVVAKLFEIVRPDRAYFGRKDAQQCFLVERMVEDLNLPVEVVPCPTVRDEDGLALSSRNAYLSAGERERARCIPRALGEARGRFAAGERDARRLAAGIRSTIEGTPGASLDYAAVVDPDTFEEASGRVERALALVAVRVGKTRLIDNERLDG